MFNNILVVCSGNICRSPIGEALLRDRLDGKLGVSSAGCTALVGYEADATAQEVMRARGGDISSHRARQINAALLADQDLILTMDGFHDEWLQAKFPQLRGRVFRIRHWCEDKTVEDPYKMPRFAFERAYDEILEGVEAWLPKLG